MTKTFKQLRKDKLNEQHFSHVGQNVSQKLSYDNWLKKVKGIEKGAHGIKGDEHTKFSKQWKDYRGKDKLAASYEQVTELKEGYQGNIIAHLGELGIASRFSYHKLIVKKADLARVKDALKDGIADRGSVITYHRMPEIVTEGIELEEGRMKELHTLIQQGKSAEEIAKIMKLDVKTIKSLMPKEATERPGFIRISFKSTDDRDKALKYFAKAEPNKLHPDYSWKKVGSAVIDVDVNTRMYNPVDVWKKHMKIDFKVDKITELKEVSPPGWGGSVKAMKKHADIDNPYALAWHMKNKGDKPHYKDKDGPPVKKDKYKDEQMEQVTEKLDVKWDKDKEGWFDKQGKRRYLGKGATTDLMRKAIDKAKASGDWIKPFDLQHGQRPEEKEIEMKKENKYFDTKSGSIEDSIKQMYQLESTEVTVNRKELDKLVKQYIAKGGTVTKLPPALSPDEDPDPKRKAYKVKKVGNTYKILKASLREFIKTYNEHFLTNYAAEEFIAEEK